jgi:hypothetical protein
MCWTAATTLTDCVGWQQTSMFLCKKQTETCAACGHGRAASHMAPGCEDNIKARLVVVSSPDAPELSVLKSLPPDVKVMGVGRSLSDFPGVPAQGPSYLCAHMSGT